MVENQDGTEQTADATETGASNTANKDTPASPDASQNLDDIRPDVEDGILDEHTALMAKLAAAGQTGLLEQLTAAQQEANTNLEGWQRARAEFANYKKRVERELHESYDRATIDTLIKLLPVIDDFERAMDNVPEQLGDHPWVEGVTLIQRKFQKMLDELEVIPLDPVGEVFDPNFHEAVGVDADTDVESGHVSQTLQKGYACGDRVLRPALVRVAS
jgi:molecular chaperone GrpE